MQHGIGVDAIIFRITTQTLIDRTTEIALVVQNVIELQRHRQWFSFEETLTELRIPYQFVRIHRLIAVTATGVVV